jgi:hypothetical protein
MQLGIYHKIKAISATLLVVGVIIIILLTVYFRTPIPPYPENGGQGMGLEINLGFESDENYNSQDIQQKTETENLITQDYEEADAIRETDTLKKAPKDKKQVKRQEKPILNQNALFKKRNTNNENSSNAGTFGTYSQQGSGIGDGSGTGKGQGTGTGIGNGVSFSLEGRTAMSLVKPKGDFQTSGKVVVEITVDKNGNVISAIPGVKGSTTLDEFLLQIAKDAAMSSKFSSNPKSTIQKGTITYRFILQ